MFCNFWMQRTFQHWTATKWLEINQDNLHMKFPAFNVNFSSPSPDPLGSSRPAAGHQIRLLPPLKSGYLTSIISCSVKTVADRQRHAAYHNKQQWQAFYWCEHWWPWISKIGVLMFFCNLWLQHRFQEWLASRWIEIDQDNLQIGTAKAVARLMSFAQITCFCNHTI